MTIVNNEIVIVSVHMTVSCPNNNNNEVAQRFLRLLRKYEKTHAAPKQIYACDPPRSDGE